MEKIKELAEEFDALTHSKKLNLVEKLSDLYKSFKGKPSEELIQYYLLKKILNDKPTAI